MCRRGTAPVDRFGRLTDQLQLQLPLPTEVLDQVRHRIAAIAGAQPEAQAEAVGVEFLLTRIAAQRKQAVARHRATDRDRAGRGRSLDGGVEHALPRLGALGGMPLDEMAKLVPERGRELGLVVQPGQQSTRDDDVIGPAWALAIGTSITTKW